MASSLPLPNGFFNAAGVRLSDERRRQLIEHAEASIRKVFALADLHQNSWIPVREKKGVAVYRNFVRSQTSASTSNVAEVGGKAELRASLDELARVYAAHDDALFRRLTKKLLPSALDAAVVCTVVPRTPRAPFRYVGVKWFAVKTPTPLVSHRDYCCLEVIDKVTDAFGNEMLLRVLHSVDVGECPSLENSHGLVRARVLLGCMYRVDRAEPLVVRVHHVLRLDPAGYFPAQWAYKTAEAQLVASVEQLKRVVERQQMNACTFVDRKQWVPNHARVHCAVCSRAFGAFRPRHHCRCCGEVICGKCSVFKAVDVPGASLQNVRICAVCNVGVQQPQRAMHSTAMASATARRNGHDQEDDEAMSDISTSSVTSSSTIAHNEMNLMDLYLSAHPDTPSAYSTASAQSNLSMRSTVSSRSATVDARHRATTPTAPRFFKSGQLVNVEHHTPRAYVGGSLTPRNLAAFGLAAPPSNPTTPSARSNRAFSTQSATAMNVAATTTTDDDDETAAATGAADAATAEEAEQRMSSFKHNPLDLGYLRESVRQTARPRGESSAEQLPPAKVARVEPPPGKDEDVDMDGDSRAAVLSATASESSATVQPLDPEELTPKKSFLGGLFSRASLDAKPPAA